MAHKKYPKIYRIGHEDTDGILEGTCYIQEKIDGANASIWLEDGAIHTGSRSRDVSNESFNGFTEWANTHDGIQKYLTENPNHRLYGEYLVRHTIQYKETSYKKFYLYDIWVDDGSKTIDTETDEEIMEEYRLPFEKVYEIATQYDIPTATLLAKLDSPNQQTLNSFLGQSVLGEVGEGIVIKNPDFVNQWGHRTYGKMVTPEFKEDNGIVFGGNDKHSESYNEIWVMNKFMTLPRIKKTMDNIQPHVGKKLGMEHTARVIQTAYHDLITEEIWTIQKKFANINFRKLSRLCTRKAAQVYHDILHGDVSVADKPKEDGENNDTESPSGE